MEMVVITSLNIMARVAVAISRGRNITNSLRNITNNNSSTRTRSRSRRWRMTYSTASRAAVWLCSGLDGVGFRVVLGCAKQDGVRVLISAGYVKVLLDEKTYLS